MKLGAVSRLPHVMSSIQLKYIMSNEQSIAIVWKLTLKLQYIEVDAVVDPSCNNGAKGNFPGMGWSTYVGQSQ